MSIQDTTEPDLQKDFHQPYRMKRAKRVPFKTEGPSMTKQSFKDECNINKIMKKFEATGLVTHVNNHQGDYGDFADAPDFHEAQNLIVKAQEMFQTVPASIRQQFGNDPGLFLDFVEDPANIPRMREMGLMPKQSVRKDAATSPGGTQSSPGTVNPSPNPNAHPGAPQEAPGGGAGGGTPPAQGGAQATT